MRFASLPFKCRLPIGSISELSQPGQRGFSTLAQIGEDFVKDAVQAVGGHGLAHPRPPGNAFRDIGLVHLAVTISAGPS
jgi:hypothetical protein